MSAEGSVAALKAQLEEQQAVPAEEMRLVYGGVSLADDALVSDVLAEEVRPAEMLGVGLSSLHCVGKVDGYLQLYVWSRR